MTDIAKYPSTWPSAVPLTGHCGACQIQAMLAAEGIQKGVNELYVSRIHRDGFGTGISWDHTYTMPWDITRILGRHGIATKTRIRRGTSLLPVALAALERGHPLIILIRSTISGGLHWISLWDYDKARDVFIAYDSQAVTKEGGVGNTEYSPAFLETKLPFFGTLWAIEVQLN
jgi:hypothetical protein